jgi:ubiquinone/menaquinone biosynthesis C-methylase UbiE
MPIELSTDRILTKVAALARQHTRAGAAKSLDIGAGTGALISRLQHALPGIETHACDYTGTLMETPGQAVDVVNLNESPLPYPSKTFDLVTCTELVEHLENYRAIIREIFRVIHPGGVAIFSTPNILNLQSRIRFLVFGFWNLFGPLPIGRAESFSTVGHITPVSYFYLAHALAEAGFELCPLEIDKVQRSAVPNLLFLWPLIALFGYLARKREIRKYNTIDLGNLDIVKAMNSLRMLLGRTIIVVARRPSIA